MTTIRIPVAAAPWLGGYNRDVERAISAVRPAAYTVTTVPPAAGNTGLVIFVSNEVGGATLAFSDGTNWRRVQDRVVIS